jgi:hypothetical protein
MFENKEKHPSYGMLSFNRTSGGVTNLFGSSIQHRDTIRMRLKEGEIDRHLNSDYYFGHKEIVEVEMSYSQFAEAITSMNQGSGVPVTIKYIQGKGRIEDCPFTDKRTQFENEFKNDITRQNELANNLIEETQKLFDEKKTFNKADKENILKILHKLKQEIGCNTEFTYEMFNEQMDKTTLEAKGEIEAFMQNKINSIANLALVEHKEELTKLNNPIDL